MTQFEFLKNLHKEWCFFMSRERPGRASNSELHRWFKNKAVIVNGNAVEPDEEVNFPIESYVLFPNKPVTLRGNSFNRYSIRYTFADYVAQVYKEMKENDV